MTIVDHFDQIKKMSRLIRSGQTGTPPEFAASIGISRSHLFRNLHQLEQYGMEVKYSRLLKT